MTANSSYCSALVLLEAVIPNPPPTPRLHPVTLDRLLSGLCDSGRDGSESYATSATGV